MSSYYARDDDARPYGAVAASSTLLEQRILAALRIPEIDPAVGVGLIGCGWVAGMQLDAYRRAGVTVTALCDLERARADRYRSEFYPDAAVFDDVAALLSHPDVAVVDIATHVDVRPDLVRQALTAGKHVLSQKPFVEDLDVGLELAEIATQAGRILAVNQNGRWAPHFGAMLALVQDGLIGTVTSADFHVAWPHDLVVEQMPLFASMEDLILFDFGAHWFDVLGLLAPEGELTVRAVTGRRPGQAIAAPTQATATVTADAFVATLAFRAAERFVETGQFRVSGTAGVVTHTGKHLGGREIFVSTEHGEARISISDNWLRHGMTGTMAALLEALSTGTPPPNSPESALRGLAVCFAATESARTGTAQIAGGQRRREGAA